MITRRRLLQGLAAFTASTVGMASYAFAIEPAWRLRVTRYAFTPAQWPDDLSLSIAIIADLHACEPWLGARRVRTIVDQTNALGADIVLLLGDYAAGHRWVTGTVASAVWAAELGRLKAPLGVHAILGNHDWWDDKTVQRQGHGPTYSHAALKAVGIPVYDNTAIRLTKSGRSFWLAGLGDQLAFHPSKRLGRVGWRGVDDLPATLAQITDDAPVILMAHEPDIFAKVPDRIALTLSGHTHGGQVRMFGYSPVVPSRYGNRYAYGHIIERHGKVGQQNEAMSRHLVVSGGLGCSIAPVRLGVPPEIVTVTLGRPVG
jgi:uncharacterized protein